MYFGKEVIDDKIIRAVFVFSQYVKADRGICDVESNSFRQYNISYGVFGFIFSAQ